MSSERKLVLRQVVKDVKNMKHDDIWPRFGAAEDHYGFYWKVNAIRQLIRGPDDTLDILSFGIGCKKDIAIKSDNWSLVVDHSLQIMDPSGRAPKIYPTVKETFKSDDADWVVLNFLNWKEKDQYLNPDGSITVEYHVAIKKCAGISNFENFEEFSKVVLVCDDGNVSLEKQMLISKSEYFKNAILNGNFEKGKIPEIRLRGVRTDDVYDFSSACYGRIDEECVRGAYNFAEKFKIPEIMKKCDAFWNKVSSSEDEEDETSTIEGDLNDLKIDSDSEAYVTADEGDGNGTLKSFKKWNSLSDKLKMCCIEKLDFKTRFLLRATCRAERCLVDSQKFKVHEVNIQNSATGMYLEIVMNDKSTEDYFVDSKNEKRMIESLYPLLAFVLKNGELTFFQSGGFPNMTPQQLAVFNPIDSFQIRRIMFLGGTSAQMMWLFSKCAPNTIATVEMAPSDSAADFLFDPMIRLPALGDFKKFIINNLPSRDVPFKMVLFFMEKDSDIGIRFNFTTSTPGTMQLFAGTFRNRIVSHVPNKLIRIATNNPQKNIILHYERSVSLGPDFHFELYVLSVVPAGALSTEEYEKYTKYNVVFVE